MSSGSPAKRSDACSSQTSRAALCCAQIGCQFGVIAVGIVNQKSRMHFKKLGQQGTRRLRHVPPRSALNLRDIGLADALALLFADRCDQFLLSHRAVQAAQGAFHLTQVADFLGQLHISIRNIYIAICNIMSRVWISNRFRGL